MPKTELPIVFAPGTFWTRDILASSHREAPPVTRRPMLDGADFYIFNSDEMDRSDFVIIVAVSQGFPK